MQQALSIKGHFISFGQDLFKMATVLMKFYLPIFLDKITINALLWIGISTAAGKYKGIKFLSGKYTLVFTVYVQGSFEYYPPGFRPKVNVVHRRLRQRLASSSMASFTFYIGILKAVITTMKYWERTRALTNVPGMLCFIMFTQSKCVRVLHFHLSFFLYINLTSIHFSFLSNSHLVWNIHIDFQTHCIIIAWLTYSL